jgi:hypothetical protein
MDHIFAFNSPVIPCCGFLALIAIIFGFVAFMRYLSYRETLALAEKGLVRPRAGSNGNGKDALRWGIVITALGMALCLGMLPLGSFLAPRGVGGSWVPYIFGPWLLIGLIPTFFGLALILIYVLTRDRKPKDAPQEPPKDEPIP